MNTYAVIVGIENYDRGGQWPILGPCANAIAVIEWLIAMGTPPGNIYAFLDPHPDHPLALEMPGLKGVRIVRSADWATIDAFFHMQLPEGRPNPSRLLLYWSGHGCTSPATGNRIFFCRDYRDELPNRVFNANTFLRTLGSAGYRSFTDQILLADVCGNYPNTPIADPRLPPERVRPPHQLAYFATPENEYAKGPNGRGVFTSTALTVLREIKGWPDHKQLVRQLKEAFSKVGQTPFFVQGFDDEHAFEHRVGTVGADFGNNHFRSAYALLSELDVVSDVFLPHYLRTVSDLGIPTLANAQGLVGVVKELSSLRDRTNGVPYGLLQFLLRLSQERALAAPLTKWLADNAAAQENTLADIRKKLALEAQRKILVVLVEVDGKGKIAKFQPFLRNSDLTPVAERTFAKRSVADWHAFESSMRELLAEFMVDGELENLEIHFLADPPLFDEPFHKIPLTPDPKGPVIGEQAVVILRHRRRVLSSDLNLQNDWKNYAAALRPAAPKDMIWLRIVPGAKLPAEKGLCFATFVLASTREGGASCESEKRLLSQLLKLGAPYLCWAHSLPAGASWETVEKDLTALLEDVRTIDAFPNKFRVERLRGSELASEVSILWDDPLAKPFKELEGVRRP
jgi:hypothetical protein